MRAIVVDEFSPPEQLRVAEVPPPVPGIGEVLVRVHAAPVNYVDLLVVGGTYQFPPPRPFIPGKGPAGVVTALGPDVTALSVGDRVLAMAEQGGYAEAVAVRADQCYRLPPRMSFLEAAPLSLVCDTAWFALRERARLAPGETVLVLGASVEWAGPPCSWPARWGHMFWQVLRDRKGVRRCLQPAPTR